MGGFSELIKNFDKTRDYMREFFIYGFKVRSDFDRKSARTYDNEKRRVESWLGEYLRYENTDRGKQTAITLDSGRIAENPLYRALESRSFTENDIRLHFFLLDLLADGQPHNLRDLTDALNAEYAACFEEQTVRGKLREYVKEGILRMETIGKTAYFRLLPDTPADYFQEYEGLSQAVQFFSCLPEFGFVGYTLLKGADLRNTIFLMKHHYIVHTLEDPILLQLTDAIRDHHAVQLEYCDKHRIMHETGVIPLKIYVSAQGGRRYLVCYQKQFRRINSYRLDYIRHVQVRKICEDFAEYTDILERNAHKCFGVSFGERREGASDYTIRITMKIDMEREPYILERLQREKRCGMVERTGSDLYTVTLTVFDANEVFHWMKTYMGRIVAIEGAPMQTMRFRRDVERMQKMYSKEADDGTVQ